MTQELPTLLAERARRLLRAWHAIRPQELPSHQGFKDLVAKFATEDLDRFDETIALAASYLEDIDQQAGFRRDVMARCGHLEGLVDEGKVAIRSDAFVLPMAGDRASMHALTQHPQAFLRLIEGLAHSGRFAPSNVALLEKPFCIELANSSALAHELCHGIGMAMLSSPTPSEQVSRPEEQLLAARHRERCIATGGCGGAVLAGVRVWFGDPSEAPDEGDLLISPDDARVRTQLETHEAWQNIVLEVLQLAQLPPGSVTILPPATFLRGLAQTRALDQIHQVHHAVEQAGRHGDVARIMGLTTGNGSIQCLAQDAAGNVLASAPEVSVREIHPEGQCFLATFANEETLAGPKTRQQQRRRGLH